ncbi:MAG: universal stress protein [Gammaproteobacteria bacterium]|jgi:universal stress protein A|nr:universal stress protein [Gammaproteobacteria bacterium]
MNDYKHVLAAIDFSSSADQVLLKARDIAQRNNAKFSLLHVVEYMPPMDYGSDPMIGNWGVDESEMQEQAKLSLQRISEQHKLENADLNVLLGTPKHEISQFVQDQQCDLVVIGSHGRHGIGLLLGSTANAVLHAMPCDILAVKIEE